MEIARMAVKIRGDVQGVGFRAYARNHARSMGIKGYVRNAWDGTVEVTAEGDLGTLQQFLDLLRQGPPFARVSDVDVEWSEATGEFHDFGVRF